MTPGIWVCLRCGFSFEAPIDYPFTLCPRCGAEYEVVERLVGAHVVHNIPVVRLKGTDLLNVPLPIVFAAGSNSSAVRRYFQLVSEVERHVEKLGGLTKPVEFEEYLRLLERRSGQS